VPEPERQSPLFAGVNSGPVEFRGPDLLIEERPFLRKTAIRGRRSDASFRRRFAEVMGVAPPAPRDSAEAMDATVISVAPSEWLLVGPHPDSGGARPLANDLQALLTEAGMVVVDVSSATTVLRVSGAGSASTLRRLCPLQLDQLPSLSAARTRVGRLAVLVHVLDPMCFDLFVPRSYARSFFDQLCDAAELRA